MQNINTNELNWFIQLNSNDTSNIEENIIDYISPKGSVLGEVYKITVYSVADNFIHSSDLSELRSALETSSVGVLSKDSIELVVKENISISSPNIINGILQPEHLGNGASPPIVEWGCGYGVDTSVVSHYYIAILNEYFEPNEAILNPTWYAEVGPEERFSHNASAVRISFLNFDYKPPSIGDDKEYSLLVIAAKSNFSPLNIRGMDLSDIISSRALLTKLNNVGILGIDSISFRIPE